MTQRKFDYKLFADYHQFYLHNDSDALDLSESWTQEAVDRMLAVAPGTIGIGTVRNMYVPVVVEVADGELADELSEWDQVNECSIEVISGRIVVAGCTDYFPDAARIEVEAGPYRARVYYGNLSSVSEDGLEGNDQYKVVLWRADPGPIRIIKQRRSEVAS